MEVGGRGGAAAGLHVRVVGARVRGKEVRAVRPVIAFVFGFIIVFLVLSAQYESWTLPGAVMSAVPFGILGALDHELAARARERRLLPDPVCWS